MDKITKQLISIGMNDTEIRAYLSILKLKQPSVTNIATDTGIKRTSIYYCLDSLQEKGLITKAARGSEKYYFPENPTESLRGLVAAKGIAVEAVLPHLAVLFSIGVKPPEIKIYRKTGGLRTMFRDTLTCKEKLIRYYLSNDNVEKMLGEEFVDAFVTERIRKKIVSRTLRPVSHKPKREENIGQASQLREIRYMPDSLIVKPYIVVYDNKISVISSPEEKVGFIIESKEFSAAQKNIFDYIWSTLN